MLEEVEFLFDNQLIAAVESLIRKAKNKLVLISPYIDLDARIQEALNEKKGLHNFELHVLFGKNENNYLRSIKKDSLEFFKEFPNVEIRHNERLHAKYYQNDCEYIMTSLNLYDYSLANNIEVGVRCVYGSTGIIGKAMDASSSLLVNGIDKVRHDVLGIEKDVNPILKFQQIFNTSDLKYKTEPEIAGKGGIQGLMGMKKLDGHRVVVNNFIVTTEVKIPITKSPEPINSASVETVAPVITGIKCVSASQISKMFVGLQAKDVTNLMERKGLINNDKITDSGKLKGIVMKNYMGNDYIAYPENLAEFNELRR